jgi:hypothetical protein
MITFTLTEITPATAAIMLGKNIDNRKLTANTVRVYAADMRLRKWRVTHQAIAVGEDGKIIDGQHRLHAIISSGETVTMYVAIYQSQHSVLSLPIDLHKKRSQVDVLKCEPRHVEVVNAIYWLIQHRAATTAETELAFDKLEPYLSQIHKVVSNRPKTRGAAGARTGVLYRMMSDRINATAYADLYRDFCLMNFDQLNTSTLSFIKTCERGSAEFGTGQSGRHALMARTVYTFDLEEQDRRLIRLSKAAEHGILEEMRQFFREVLEG